MKKMILVAAAVLATLGSPAFANTSLQSADGLRQVAFNQADHGRSRAHSTHRHTVRRTHPADQGYSAYGRARTGGSFGGYPSSSRGYINPNVLNDMGDYN